MLPDVAPQRELRSPLFFPCLFNQNFEPIAFQRVCTIQSPRGFEQRQFEHRAPRLQVEPPALQTSINVSLSLPLPPYRHYRPARSAKNLCHPAHRAPLPFPVCHRALFAEKRVKGESFDSEARMKQLTLDAELEKLL